MGLTKEASYIYIYSKELTKVNKQLKRLSKKAEKHVHKHSKTENEAKKIKHKKKHLDTTNKIKKLIKKHNQILSSIRYHHRAYHHSLHKEHKVR
tara:strand:+ start:318 stop:599 length:282 start_codon:yes stop_codon:yes gene_type:complete